MLSKFEISATRDTPYICFDKKNNVFEIKGISLPEDSMSFFEPVFFWLSEYVKSPNNNTNLVCNLEYFNSSSAKMLYELFYELEKIMDLGKNVKITWCYDKGDKLIEEKGLEFESILNIPIEFKALVK